MSNAYNLDSKPDTVGVVRGVDEDDGFYLITAEYLDHYVILGRYRTLKAAKKDAPRIVSELQAEGLL